MIDIIIAAALSSYLTFLLCFTIVAGIEVYKRNKKDG